MHLANVNIPGQTETFNLTFDSGRSAMFVGANGAGKTRLGVFIEEQLAQHKVHRVAAHRSLTISDTITSISLERALRGLHEGYPDLGAHRASHRWQGKPATNLLIDYEYLLQALFAEQNRTAVEHLEASRIDPGRASPPTILSRLKAVWERLLPHRKLRLLELSIQVLPPSSSASASSGYASSEMSDGERVIFYLIGQCLLAPKSSVVIIDEPELHIHKAIIGRLWDAIEAERPDCSFVYITHDLDFVVARPTAAKFVVRSFNLQQWDIEKLPENTGLPDRVVSELVGSRQPILFVEGERGSIDAMIYSNIYQSHLVEPIGSCEAVIHAVSSFKNNPTLHRAGDVHGCVDCDARDTSEIEYLCGRGIHVLPVAEVENVFLIPSVFVQLAIALDFSQTDIQSRLEELASDIFAQANVDLESASARYASRRLDAELKKLAPSAKSVADLTIRYNSAISSVDPTNLAIKYQTKLSSAISAKDVSGVLAIYDNKGLLSFGARRLGLKGRGELVEFAGRLLAGIRGKPVSDALKSAFPSIPAATTN